MPNQRFLDFIMEKAFSKGVLDELLEEQTTNYFIFRFSIKYGHNLYKGIFTSSTKTQKGKSVCLRFRKYWEIKNNKNSYHQIATIPESKVDKIRLINEQIKQLNNLALQLNSGSITMEEAVLQLRGSDGLINVVGILAFVIFINWYDSLFGVKAFQANPLPHQNSFGWLSGKYDPINVRPSPFRPPTSLEM